MNEQKASIKAVCISEKKGQQKHPVDAIRLEPHLGIPGDAHAGDWHRMVSVLSVESVRRLQEKIAFPLLPGAFAENVLVEGIEVSRLPVGTRLRIGSALCEVTQIGKECHADCAIRRQAGDCVMPREGIFVRVLEEGSAREGDLVEVLHG
jgi:MOSC domain-containing protein YiiM